MASRPYKSCLGALRPNSRPIVQRRRAPIRLRSNHPFTAASSFYSEPSTARESPPLGVKAAAGLARVTGRATQSYTAYGVTEKLYKECAAQAPYDMPAAAAQDEQARTTYEGEDLGVGNSWWHSELGLKPTFSTWSQVTMLHLYVIAARIRGLPRAQAGVWQQHLLDHFFYDAENRMETRHHMHSGGVRKKYLRDLFVQWRGLLCAYDEGLVRGDAVLAAAIWRNVFKADEDVDIKNLALIVSYVRRTLRSLDAVSDDTLMAGLVKFGSPAAELSVVTLRSQMMDVRLTDFEGCES